MNKAALFQDLVVNDFIPGFDYSSQNFFFETVFYVCGHSYRCCSCAFDHEYINYISDNGDVDAKIFEKITKSIKEGKCQHVDGASRQHISTTKINGMHIAAVKGIKEAVTPNVVVQLRQTDAPSGLFGITPYQMAFLKGRHEMLKPLRDGYNSSICDQFLLYCSRKGRLNEYTEMKSISLVELCVRKNNTDLLHHIVETPSNVLGLSNAVEYIFKHHLVEMETVLLRNLDNCLVQEDFESIELALIYDKPEFLDVMLQYVSTSTSFQERIARLYTLARTLKREKCIQVLSKYDANEGIGTMDDANTFGHLLEFLLKYPHLLQDHLISVLKTLPEIINVLNGTEQMGRYIHNFINENFLHLDAKKLEVLFDLETQVISRESDPSVLHHILCKQAEPDTLPAIIYRRFRKVIELCLSHNVCHQTKSESVKMPSSMIGLATTIDEKINNMTRTHLTEVDSLIMDGATHSFVGQNDADSVALNFIAPLLIHYGVPCCRKELDGFQFATLHPMEQEYLRNCTRNPRTLMLRCRDVLRQTFIGGRIREVLGESNVPRELKSFIL